MTGAEKESEARCKAMLNKLISEVKKQTMEMEDLAVCMNELAVSLKAVVQPRRVPDHTLPPSVSAPTPTLVVAVDHTVVATAPALDAALVPESPSRCTTSGPDPNAGCAKVTVVSLLSRGVTTAIRAQSEPAYIASSKSFATDELDNRMPAGCSMIGSSNDTASQTSAFMSDVAQGSPSTTSLLDVAVTSPELTIATILVSDGTSDLTTRQLLDEIPLHAMVDSTAWPRPSASPTLIFAPTGVYLARVAPPSSEVRDVCYLVTDTGHDVLFGVFPSNADAGLGHVTLLFIDQGDELACTHVLCPPDDHKVRWPPPTKWVERRAWLPAAHMEITGDSVELHPKSWRLFNCYRGKVQRVPPWPSPQGLGTVLKLFHKQVGVQSWMTKFINAAMDMLNSLAHGVLLAALGPARKMECCRVWFVQRRKWTLGVRLWAVKRVVETVGKVHVGASTAEELTINTSLIFMCTFVGRVDDTRGRFAFLDGGTVLSLPMFYLQEVVLFPEAALPLRVIQPRSLAAVDKAINHVDDPCMIGVVHVYQHINDGHHAVASVGTTAEIHQINQLDDGAQEMVGDQSVIHAKSSYGNYHMKVEYQGLRICGGDCGISSSWNWGSVMDCKEQPIGQDEQLLGIEDKLVKSGCITLVDGCKMGAHEFLWFPGDANLTNMDSRCFVIVKSGAKGRKTPFLILLRTLNIQLIMMVAELVKQCSNITLWKERDLSESDIKHALKALRKKILSLDFENSIQVHDPQNPFEYLEVLYKIRQLTKRLENLDPSGEAKERNGLRVYADDLFEMVVARLEEEFVYLLTHYKQPLEQELSFCSTEDGSTDDFSSSSFNEEQSDRKATQNDISGGSEYFVADLIQPGALSAVKSIANFMFLSDYDKECCQAYINARQGAVDKYFGSLPIDKLSIEELLSTSWTKLSSLIKRWNWAMKTADLCFYEISFSSIMQLLSFYGSVAIGPPRPEKLPRMLDIVQLLHLRMLVQ